MRMKIDVFDVSLFKNISISNRAKGLHTYSFRYSKRYSFSLFSLPNPHVKMHPKRNLSYLPLLRSLAQQHNNHFPKCFELCNRMKNARTKISDHVIWRISSALFRETIEIISLVVSSRSHSFRYGISKWFLFLVFGWLENSFVWMLLHAVNLGLESCPLHWC